MDAEITTDQARASTEVEASPEAVFEFLRRPANHLLLNGDGTVRGITGGAEVLGPGDRFGMRMKMGAPYRISSKVVEFEDGRRIAWCHFGGHRWRWELEPAGEGRCRVTETFDMSTSRMPWLLRRMGYPKRHGPNVTSSVEKVAAHFRAG